MEARYVDLLLKYRYLLSVLTVALVVALSMGARNLYFDSDYKSFFDDDDPQLMAYEALQREYTKSDSLTFFIKPESGDVFTPHVLEAVKVITEEGWQAPFSIRVDSLTNYQHSWAQGDDLTVEELVPEPSALDAAKLQRIRAIALSETELVNRIVAADGRTTIVNISMELPDIDPAATPAEQARQRQAREASFKEVSDYGNRVIDEITDRYPDLEMHMMGVPVVNYSFNESAARDSSTLIPLMYGIILLALALFFRSIGSVVACFVVIGFSTAGGMGMAGWLGYSLNSVTVIAPIIILTISVCDAVHIITMYQRHLALGESPMEAIRESLIVNLQPVVLTSVTTAVGFITLNFSESPFFRALGNISAFGVMFAMLISLTLLPTLVALVVRRARGPAVRENTVQGIADFVVARKTPVFWLSLVVAAGMIALVPLNQTNNDVINYFKKGVAYRDAAIFAQENLPAIKDMHFSLDCGSENCVNDPAFQTKLDDFVSWISDQPGVEYVGTYSNVIKRLNRNMHGDDPQWYRLPESRALAAQYQLLYEMSLPYGLDLNNLVNFDRNATRVSVWLTKVPTAQLVDIEERALAWFDANAPELKTRGASVDMMFATQNMRDIRAMSIGAVFALLGVTLTILIATRSLRHGLLSVVPNAFPAAMALGLWGLIIGEVNSAVTIVFSITLGLVVDNTVHFISKYRRGLAKGIGTEGAVRYAFSTVGSALMITAAVLTVGFGLLTLSTFNLNAYMGGLTAMTIVIALIFDFLMLPALLLLIDKHEPVTANTDEVLSAEVPDAMPT
ncbi:MAG: RND transporter [Porticoccaceae bacterium]|nr:RND transporter [Porticoccaceae bacterium]